jgi:hypothetical protein
MLSWNRAKARIDYDGQKFGNAHVIIAIRPSLAQVDPASAHPEARKTAKGKT